MPSARDLLQQADALMRSNRNVGGTGSEEVVPTLTDVAVPGAIPIGAGIASAPATGSSHRQQVAVPVPTHIIDVPETRFGRAAHADTISRFSNASEMEGSLLPLSEMPQIVDEDFPPARSREPARAIEPTSPATEMPKWLEVDLLESPSDNEKLPHTFAADDALADREYPPHEDRTGRKEPTLDDEPVIGGKPASRSEPTFLANFADEPAPAESAENPPTFVEAPAATSAAVAEPVLADAPVSPPVAESPPMLVATAAAPPAAEPAGPTAEETAEVVYYQVLQNLDLYTERALQEHLNTHLAPIIERATRELLATLNANLGALMREYIAEAIEKQIGVKPDTTGGPGTR